MTVMRLDEEDNPSLAIIDLHDCDFIENEGRRIVYHIRDEKYYHIGTKSEMEMLLEKEGFEILDRPYLVNMKHIDRFDEKFCKVFFKSTTNKSVTVARGSVKLVKEYLAREKNKG